MASNFTNSLEQVENLSVEFLSELGIMFYLKPKLVFHEMNQVPDYFQKAVPYFLLMMAIEAGIGIARGKQLYKQNDTFQSLNMGIVQMIVGMWNQGMFLSGYIFVYERFRLLSIAPESPLTWFGLFLGVDFAYYWLHRFIHEFHIGWSTHSLHHSGEIYNLATALRQGAFQPFFSFFFKLPLALFFSPACFAAHSALNTLYQFWIHTQIVGWLGPLEYVLNTASHHRVHHTVDRCNANYAGVLIIWDRMFGTFVPEANKEERDFYGLAKQYDTFDAVMANVEHPRRMLQNIDGGTSSKAWKLLFKRRIKHKLVFQPLALFEPIPVPKIYGSWKLHRDGPKRNLLDGDASAHYGPLEWYVAQLMLINFVVFVAVARAYKSGTITTNLELLLANVGSMLMISSIGRLSDSFTATDGRSLNTFRLLYFGFLTSYAVNVLGLPSWLFLPLVIDSTFWFYVIFSMPSSYYEKEQPQEEKLGATGGEKEILVQQKKEQ